MTDAAGLAVLVARFEAFVTLVDQREAATARALMLQAAEYARRLEALNHERAEARHMIGTYLTITTYDAKHTELEKIIEVMRERIVTVEAAAKVAGAAGERLSESQTWLTRVVIGAVVSIVMAALMALGALLLQRGGSL